MNKYNKLLITMILASSFLMTGCFVPNNHDKSTHEKMQDQDRQLE